MSSSASRRVVTEMVAEGLPLSWVGIYRHTGSAGCARPDHLLRYFATLTSRVVFTQERGSVVTLRSQLSLGHMPAL